MSLAPHRSIAIRTRSSSPQLNSPPPTIRIRCSPFVTLLLPGGLCSRFRRKGLSAHREVAARHLAQDNANRFARRTARNDGSIGQGLDQPFLVVRRSPLQRVNPDAMHLYLHLEHYGTTHLDTC